MTMTYDQVAELLAFCAVHDKRKGDDLDVKAWLMVAQDHGWTAAAAFRVAREHYGQGEGRPRLEAPAITDRIRAIRRRAVETFPLPVIPDDVSNADYPKWLRTRRNAHRDALVEQWAAAGKEPPTQLSPGPPPNQIGQRRVAAITSGAFQDVPDVYRDNRAPTADDLTRPCPYCRAQPGNPCTRAGGSGRIRMKHPHPARGTRTSAEEAS